MFHLACRVTNLQPGWLANRVTVQLCTAELPLHLNTGLNEWFFHIAHIAHNLVDHSLFIKLCQHDPDALAFPLLCQALCGRRRAWLLVTSALVMGLAAWMNSHNLFSLSLFLPGLSVSALSLRAWALYYPGWTHDLSVPDLRGDPLAVSCFPRSTLRQAYKTINSCNTMH